MHELDTLSVPQMAAAVRTRRIGAREFVAASLAAIEARDGILNAVVALDAERALQRAAAVDEDAVTDPDRLPPYAGIPTLVKDLNNVAGVPTTFGAVSMAEFVPPFDDESVSRLRSAGFIILGKTNVPEIGSLPWTEPLLHGPCRNPWDTARTPGGSSGGAAAAVAAGYVPAAHGSDGGGSIRIPASNCGIVGIKPGRGRISNAPLFGDQVMGYATQGPLGRRVVDAAAMLDALQGYAPGDPYHLPPPTRPFVAEVGIDPGRLRIGLVSETPWATPDDDVQAGLAVAIAVLQRLGHTVEPLRLRLPTDVIETFLTVWSASVAASPLPAEQLEPHNQQFAARGHATSAPALLQAFASLQLVSRSLVAACAQVDAVLAPVLMQPPPLVGAHAGLDLDELTDVMARYLGFTPVINVTGQAAIALPVHMTPGGLPIGVQLIGRAAGEAELIRLAAQVEAASGWVDRRPPPPRG